MNKRRGDWTDMKDSFEDRNASVCREFWGACVSGLCRCAAGV
jgi:hypothetical protein